METPTKIERSWSAWLRGGLENYAGWLVLVAVLMLLEGPTGALVALRAQAADLFSTFVGSERQEVLGVAAKTLPLVLATAAMTFLFLRRWLPDGMGAIYVAAIVILSTGWLAGELNRTVSGQLAEASAGLEGVPKNESQLAILPNDLSGMLGIVAQATNQLAGYLWEYGLNLSAASIIVGGYIGWKLHRRLTVVEKTVVTLQSHWKRAA